VRAFKRILVFGTGPVRSELEIKNIFLNQNPFPDERTNDPIPSSESLIHISFVEGGGFTINGGLPRG
jgi:hypothetical protein